MKLTCKTCLYRRKAKDGSSFCFKRHIRISLRRKYCELYEPK
mgnify:CR=1 FL=1